MRTGSVRISLVVKVVCLIAVAECHANAEDKPPTLRVESVQRVYHNGEHNAFTDLCRFGHFYYLTFRQCADGHGVSPRANIVVLQSADGNAWKPVHQFGISKRDTRDPHFLVYQDKLWVITGTWYCGDAIPKTRELNEHLGYACSTSDGQNWTAPFMLEGTYGHYVWRAASHDGKAYLCGRRKKEFQRSEDDEPSTVESVLLESDDGLRWRPAGFFQDEHGDETAFLFEEDGAILALARGGKGKPVAEICRSKSPYTVWKRTDLDRQVGGPLLVKWGGRILVAGRKSISAPKTAIYWLVNDQLQEIVELPSSGDNSYCGFVAIDDSRAWMSYYSSHDRDEQGKPMTAIYLAKLRVEP